ncbi:MAG: hypothetical protein AAF891_07410 [Pseudomonadota bacterium]
MRLGAVLAMAAALCYALLIHLMLRDGGALFGDQAALDLRVAGYTAEEARRWLEGLTEAQRATYFGALAMVDTLFPVLLGAALAVFLWQLGGKWVIALPVAYAVSDLLENSTIRSLPEVANFAQTATWASTLTLWKFASLLVAALALGWRIWQRRQR